MPHPPRILFFAIPKRHGPGWVSPVYRHHPVVELFFVTKGTGQFISLGESHPVRPGTLVVLAPEADHAWRTTGCSGLAYGFLTIREWDPARLDQVMEGRPCRVFRLEGEVLETYRHLYELLVTEELTPDDHTTAFARGLIHAIWALLERAKGARKRALGTPFSEPIRKARAYIREHWHENPSTDAIARGAGVSPGHLRSLFRRETGEPPRGYLLSQKVLAAKDLLLSTELPPKVIAERLGFVSVHPFTAFFHKRAGLPPAAWRKHARA
ncbi:MAG: AraC family transcriptional regulator [Planctomycetota bacterium]